MALIQVIIPLKNTLCTLRYLIGFKNLLRSIESIGVSAVYGINYFGRGILGTESYINYVKYDVLGKDLLNSSLNYVPYLKDQYLNVTNSIQDYGSIKNRYLSICIYDRQFTEPSCPCRSRTISQNKKRVGNVDDAINYYDSMTSYIDRLRNLHTDLRHRIKYASIMFVHNQCIFHILLSFRRDIVQSHLDEATSREAVGIIILGTLCVIFRTICNHIFVCFAVTVLIVSPIIIILVKNAVATIQVN